MRHLNEKNEHLRRTQVLRHRKKGLSRRMGKVLQGPRRGRFHRPCRQVRHNPGRIRSGGSSRRGGQRRDPEDHGHVLARILCAHRGYREGEGRGHGRGDQPDRGDRSTHHACGTAFQIQASAFRDRGSEGRSPSGRGHPYEIQVSRPPQDRYDPHHGVQEQTGPPGPCLLGVQRVPGDRDPHPREVHPRGCQGLYHPLPCTSRYLLCPPPVPPAVQTDADGGRNGPLLPGGQMFP